MNCMEILLEIAKLFCMTKRETFIREYQKKAGFLKIRTIKISDFTKKDLGPHRGQSKLQMERELLIYVREVSTTVPQKIKNNRDVVDQMIIIDAVTTILIRVVSAIVGTFIPRTTRSLVRKTIGSLKK